MAHDPEVDKLVTEAVAHLSSIPWEEWVDWNKRDAPLPRQPRRSFQKALPEGEDDRPRSGVMSASGENGRSCTRYLLSLDGPSWAWQQPGKGGAMTDRFWRARGWSAIALSMGLAFAGVARADVDITGDWDVQLQFGGFFMSVVQQGTVLTIQRPPFSPGSGVIDPATGAFQMTFSDACGVSTFSGTVTPDQHSMSGSASVSLVGPMGCVTVPTTFTGTRRGCGDGVVGAGEECDDGNTQPGDCCSATCSFETAGVSCPGATGTCTRGTCDGAGACDVTSPSVAPAGTVCRPVVDVCDLAEVCDGISLGCPADQVRPAGTFCRAASGPCDVAEFCDGSAALCPPPAGPPDTDGDGIGDPCDRCPTGGRAGEPRLKLARYDGVFGNDTLSARATITPVVGPLDPVASGLAIVVGSPATEAGGLDLFLPPGAYDPAVKRGWAVSKSERTWTFRGGDVKLTAVKAKVQRPRDGRPEVQVTVRGRRGGFANVLPLQPTALRLVFGSPLTPAPVCGEVVFDGGGPDAATCTLRKAGEVVDCRGG